ncbi:MAG: DUF1801 domain-containing protein [Deltaproteobacteria bacterium]
MNPKFASAEVAQVFAAVPTDARARLLEVRSLIFDVAAKTPEVGPIEEALRWGEPSYLTKKTKSGTTVRIHWKAKHPDDCALYVSCQTDLVEGFRLRHAGALRFEGQRAVLFGVAGPLPEAALRDCIREALTYHVNRARAATRVRGKLR